MIPIKVPNSKSWIGGTLSVFSRSLHEYKDDTSTDICAPAQCRCLRIKRLEFSYKLIIALKMSSEEVIEEVEALSAILEEDTVDVVREEDGERLKVLQHGGDGRELNLIYRRWLSRYFP